MRSENTDASALELHPRLPETRKEIYHEAIQNSGPRILARRNEGCCARGEAGTAGRGRHNFRLGRGADASADTAEPSPYGRHSRQKTQSIAELAVLTGRAQPNLTRTLGKLEAVGFVHLQNIARRKVQTATVHSLRISIDPFSQTDRLELA